MSRAIQHGLPCDDCGSSDAKAKYPPGVDRPPSTHCFSCGTTHRLDQQRSIFDADPIWVDILGKMCALPIYDFELASNVNLWLRKYNITDEDIVKYRLGSTNRGADVVLPVYNYHDELQCFQMRAFGEQTGPKYITVGDRVLFYSELNYFTPKILVLVEDILSAIRVGHTWPAAALLGTNLSRKNLLTLVRNYDKIIVWLDSDKPGQAAAKKIIQQLRPYDIETANITTKEDPKCLFNSEIKQQLTPFIDNL